MSKRKGNGVLYLAIGLEHYNEAVLSLSTVKYHMPDTPAAIVTNIQGDAMFDIVIEVQKDEYDPLDKIEAISNSPFYSTIFLDSDTYLCTPIHQVFDILDHFDVAATMQANRINHRTGREVPRIFPEVNSGFLAYRNSKPGSSLMAEWIESYHNAPNTQGDMGALREALFYSDARLCILPPEFNLHIPSRAILGPDAVRVLHGAPCPDRELYESIRKQVNSEGKYRLYTPDRELWQT